MAAERRGQVGRLARPLPALLAASCASDTGAPEAVTPPRDASAQKCSYGIESRVPGTSKLRFIEIKGRRADGKTIAVTRNEVLVGLNKPGAFILALVRVLGDRTRDPPYVQCPFTREPDFGVTSVNCDIAYLLSRARGPA